MLAKVLQIALFVQVNAFHTCAETGWCQSAVKDNYQVSNHSSHSVVSNSNSQRAGYHTYPSQYHTAIGSWHDKPTSPYFQFVMLDLPFFLKELVVFSWLLLATAMVYRSTDNLPEHSNHHAFMLSWITFMYKNRALIIVVTWTKSTVSSSCNFKHCNFLVQQHNVWSDTSIDHILPATMNSRFIFGNNFITILVSTVLTELHVMGMSTKTVIQLDHNYPQTSSSCHFSFLLIFHLWSFGGNVFHYTAVFQGDRWYGVVISTQLYIHNRTVKVKQSWKLN
jgi:hypothetical protein